MGSATKALIEPTLTMTPADRWRIDGSTWRTRRCGPTRLRPGCARVSRAACPRGPNRTECGVVHEDVYPPLRSKDRVHRRGDLFVIRHVERQHVRGDLRSASTAGSCSRLRTPAYTWRPLVASIRAVGLRTPSETSIPSPGRRAVPRCASRRQPAPRTRLALTIRRAWSIRCHSIVRRAGGRRGEAFLPLLFLLLLDRSSDRHDHLAPGMPVSR